MIDCSSPREKSDASGKSCSFSFFFLKRRIRGLPRKAVINVLSAGNPIPRANEGGIYHGADVTVTALQVAGNNLFSFLVMVRKSTDVSGVKKKKHSTMTLQSMSAPQPLHLALTLCDVHMVSKRLAQEAHETVYDSVLALPSVKLSQVITSCKTVKRRTRSQMSTWLVRG